MSTLADELLADFGDDVPEEEEEEEDAQPMEEDDEGDEGEEKDAEEKLLESLKNEDINKVAHLINSEKFKTLLERVEAQQDQQMEDFAGPIEDNPEYQLIVESNTVVSDINNEIQLIHKYIRDLYALRFPELESLVPNSLDYARVVKRIGNQTDMTQVELADILPGSTIMIVSVAASTTAGRPLDDVEFGRTMQACDMALQLDDARKKILTFVESRMTFIAPNLSALVGSSVAAKLIAAAGGLVPLSKIPSCNLMLLGAPKRQLSGFSSASSRRCLNGYLLESDIVTKCPPSLRLKAARVVTNKATLCSRLDSSHGSRSGEFGRTCSEDLLKKMEKWQEPPPPKQPKPLAAPDDKPRKKRAGVRVRRVKEKYAMTEMRKQSNRMVFGVAEEEVGVTGTGMGMIGISGSGKVRLTAQEKNLFKKQKQQTQQQQQHQKNFGTSGLTSGLASSLAFTPVQGLELANPEVSAQAAKKLKALSEKYFANSGSFANVNKKQKTEQNAEK